MQSLQKGCEDSFHGETADILLYLIHSGKPNTRSNLGDLEGLGDSISQHGLINPILVRRVGASRYEVVAGSRRLKTFERLGYPSIPAIIIEADDKKCFEISLTENVQRQTLDPLDEARAFYDYVCSKEEDGLGYGSITQLAKRIGKSQEYVSNRIGLLRLPKSTLRQLLGERKLSVSHVEELASISENPMAVKELADLIATRRISVRVLEKAVQLIKNGLETARALDLAEVESDMRLESTELDQDPDLVNMLMKRSKRVLEAALSYLDNTAPELEKEPTIYSYWLENVRLPVHKAIDGAIVCQKRALRANATPTNVRKRRSVAGASHA
ncbi:MAG: ParB/RepB/Spo0J family partition protein [Thaumarchaeota archaeon]|nr:ParB/RepB/Spo0J family partition protein [Nitrososphaerota archaeon]